MPRDSASSDRGMLVLEQKLSILRAGPGHTRRNPALDVLTGRVPDERLQSLQTVLLTVNGTAQTTPVAQAPAAMVLPLAAIRMAAVARSSRPAPSPWLQASASTTVPPRLKLVAATPSRWLRLPWLGPLLIRLRAERRPYSASGRSPRPHPAS